MSSHPRWIARDGFTLLEVSVALALAGVLLLGARLMLGPVGDAAERVASEAARADLDANGERLLRDLAYRAELRFDEGPRFRGEPHAARWSTWCDVPAGWQERCEVTLAPLRAGERQVLAVSLPGGVLIPVRVGFRAARIRYLATPGDGGGWADRWDSEHSVPQALAVILDADTLLLRIGERG